MASLLEPPPLAAVAAVVGFAALSLALGMTGGRREAVAEERGAPGVVAIPDPDELSEARTPDPTPVAVASENAGAGSGDPPPPPPAPLQ
jgi:hypothetical protein